MSQDTNPSSNQDEIKFNIETIDNDLDKYTNENIEEEANKIRSIMEEKDKQFEEQIIKTKINNVNAEIVIKKSDEPQKSENEIKKEIKEKHKKISKEINEKTKLIENEFKEKFKYSDYSTSSEHYEQKIDLIYNFLLFPDENVRYEKEEHKFCNTNDFIRTITSFKDYDAFALPDEKLLHNISESLVIIKHCNEIFDYEFVKNNTLNNVSISDLDKNILNFIYNYYEYQSTRFEKQFITTILTKIILLLNCSVDFAFRDNTVKTDDEFLIAINPDVVEMEKLQNKKGAQFCLWKVFIDALLSTKTKKSERMIYKHEGYERLNYFIMESLQKNIFLLQELLGNMLKCYVPTVIMSYFNFIKTIHLISRLITLYAQLQLYKGKTKDEQVYDIYCITAMCVINYEIKYNLWRQIPKKPLDGINEKTQLYLNNHVITGGQYFILKEIENSIGVICRSFV